MKILTVSDTHCGAGQEHRRDALADCERVLDQVVDLAIGRNVDLLLHAGDLMHRSKPSPPELHLAKRFFNRLSREGIPAVVLTGNGAHSAPIGEPSAEELFEAPLVRVSRRPEFITEFANVAVCTLPPAPPGHLMARNGASREQAQEAAVDLLVQAARDLFAEAPDDRPRILLAHQMVSGASLPTGLPVEQVGASVLPLWALEEIGYDAVVLGDLHMAQVLREAPFIGYCGSPWRNDFGEAGNEPGVWLLDLDTVGTLHAPAEFVPLEDRRFVSVQVDLTDPQVESDAAELRIDETDTIVAAIGVHFPLPGAVVRVKYKASEEQHRRVDHAALLRLLEDAGAHRVYGGIQWLPVREERAREPEVDEGMAPLAALERWLAAQEVDGERAAGLRALLGGWVAEAA